MGKLGGRYIHNDNADNGNGENGKVDIVKMARVKMAKWMVKMVKMVTMLAFITTLQGVRVHGGPGGEGGQSSDNIVGKYFSQVSSFNLLIFLLLSWESIYTTIYIIYIYIILICEAKNNILFRWRNLL